MLQGSKRSRCRNVAIILLLAGICGRVAASGSASDEQDSPAEERTDWTWLKPETVKNASRETAEILPDASIQLSKPAPTWSECSVSFPACRAFCLQRFKVEFLPQPGPAVDSLGRDNRPPVVFSLKAYRERNGQLNQLEASECQCGADDIDEQGLSNLIDEDTGSGLKLPEGGKPFEVTVQLSAPYEFVKGDKLVVVVDSGGNASDGVVSRFRVGIPVTR